MVFMGMEGRLVLEGQLKLVESRVKRYISMSMEELLNLDEVV